MSRRDSVDKIERVLVKAYNVAQDLEEKALKESKEQDISITEVRTLDVIGTGRLKTMGEVAKELGISVSTLTISVNKLEKKGYVIKMKCDRDRRVVRVKLTEKGRKAVRRHRVFRRQIASKMLLKMPTKEVESLAHTIEELDSYLDLLETKHMKNKETGA